VIGLVQHGLRVTVESDRDEDEAAFVGRFTGAIDVVETRMPGDLHLQISTVDDVTVLGPAAPHQVGREVYIALDGYVRYDPSRDELLLGYRDLVAGRVRLGEGRATIAVRERTGDLRWLLTHPFLTLPLMAVARRMARYPLHAACVRFEGTTLLLAGTSGAGKTTTALALALAGGRLQSDDMVWLRDGERSIEILPLRDEVDVTDDTLAMLPELRRFGPRRPPGSPKWSLPASSGLLAPESTSTDGDTLLLFPSVGRAQPGWSPSSAPAALRRVLPDALVLDPPSTRSHVDVLHHFVTLVPTAELHLGDPGDAAALVRACLVGLEQTCSGSHPFRSGVPDASETAGRYVR
jgi:hypothetical protein